MGPGKHSIVFQHIMLPVGGQGEACWVCTVLCSTLNLCSVSESGSIQYSLVHTCVLRNPCILDTLNFDHFVNKIGCKQEK